MNKRILKKHMSKADNMRINVQKYLGKIFDGKCKITIKPKSQSEEK